MKSLLTTTLPTSRPLNKSLWFSAILLATSALSFQAKATSIAYEGFDYGTGALQGNAGGTGWSNSGGSTGWYASDNDTSKSNVVSSSLNYTGTGLLSSSGNSATLYTPNNSSYPAATRNFSTTVTSGNLYVSYLFSLDTLNKGYALMRLQDGTSNQYNGATLVEFGGNNNPSQAGLQGLNGGPNFNAGQVYFLTLEIQNINTGANGTTLNLFLDGDFSAPLLTTTATLASVGGLDLNVGPYSYFGGGQGNFTLGFDEIRVGTTLADVAAVPEPSTWLCLSVAGILGVVIRHRKLRVRSA